MAFPGVPPVISNIYAGSQTYGVETNILANLVDDPIVESYRMDLFVGFRYIELLETLRIASVTSFFRENQPGFESFAGDTIQVYDSFGPQSVLRGPDRRALYAVWRSR